MKSIVSAVYCISHATVLSSDSHRPHIWEEATASPSAFGRPTESPVCLQSILSPLDGNSVLVRGPLGVCFKIGCMSWKVLFFSFSFNCVCCQSSINSNIYGCNDYYHVHHHHHSHHHPHRHHPPQPSPNILNCSAHCTQSNMVGH